MLRDYFHKRRRLERSLQCLFIVQLLSIAGCQPAGPVNPAVIETADLVRIDASTFVSEVVKNDKPVLVEVAVDSGCPACEAMKPQMTEVARQIKSDVKVVRLDHRANLAFVQQMGVTVCPSYLIFYQGKLAESISGQTSADLLLDRLYSFVSDIDSSKPNVDDSENYE